MSASNTVTGANTVLVYQVEPDDEFASDPSEIQGPYRTLGVNETFDPDQGNNPERQFRPGRRQAEMILESSFEGSWSADFTMTRVDWMEMIFGEAQSTDDFDIDGGFYSAVEGGDAFGFAPDNPPRTIQFIEETWYPDGTVEQTVYKGCATSSASFDVSVEDVIEVSLDGEYSTEETKLADQSEDPEEFPLGELVGPEQPERQNRPFHFGNALMEIDVDGEGIDARAAVQDVSVDIDQDMELQYEVGSRFAQVPTYMAIEPSMDYTALVTDQSKADEKQQMYGEPGATEPQSVLDGAGIRGRVWFDNGIEDDPIVSIEILGAFPEDYTRNNIGDPQEVLEDDVTRMVSEVIVGVEGLTEQ